MPTTGEHLTAKYYVDNTFYSVAGSSFLTLDTHEILKLGQQNSIILFFTLTSPETTIENLPNHMLIA